MRLPSEGNSLDKRIVALKVEMPDKTVEKPVKMMEMDGSFGAEYLVFPE